MKTVKEEFEIIIRVIKAAEMDGVSFIGADRFAIDNTNGKLRFSLNFEQDYKNGKEKEESKITPVDGRPPEKSQEKD